MSKEGFSVGCPNKGNYARRPIVEHFSATLTDDRLAVCFFDEYSLSSYDVEVGAPNEQDFNNSQGEARLGQILCDRIRDCSGPGLDIDGKPSCPAMNEVVVDFLVHSIIEEDKG